MAEAKKTVAKKAPPRKKAPAKKVAAKPAVGKTAEEPSSTPVTTDVEEDAPVEQKAPKPPPVTVPLASRASSGFSKRTRTLQVMLTDLGYYTGRQDGFYTTPVRNAVSALQQDLPGYRGAPHGAFDEATRDALLESDFPTTT